MTTSNGRTASTRSPTTYAPLYRGLLPARATALISRWPWRSAHLSYARRFLVEARDHVEAAIDRAPDDASAVSALRFAAGIAFAEMRGEAAFSLLQAGSARALQTGDTRTAAIALAAAATIGGRCPGLFDDPLPHQELVALVDRARALHPPGDLEVDAYIALAAAWDGARALAVPDRERAKEALVVAHRLGDPVLIEQCPRCQLRGGLRGQLLQTSLAIHSSAAGAPGATSASRASHRRRGG